MPVRTSKGLNSMVGSNDDGVGPVECGETAATGNKWEKAVETCNSGSTFKVTARAANHELVPPPNHGAAMIFSPIQCRSLVSMGVHSDEKIVESPTLPKGELSSGGVDCHSLKLTDHQSDKAQLDKFEVLLSDTCQRRFVMFDQSGGKKRMIFHPSMLHEFSALRQSPLKMTNCKEHTSIERTSPVGHLREILVGPLCLEDSSYLDTILPPGWRSTVSLSREEDAFQALYATFAQGSSQDRVTDCLSKENTEDLEALLWSDDGMSSEGHSPSDLTWSDADSLKENVGGLSTACADKKRKACVEVETDCTATSTDSTLKKVLCSEVHRSGRGSGYGKEGFAVSELSSADEESSSGSTSSSRQHQMGSFAHKQLAKKTRKDKIHSTLQLLRSIIPGGESMDAPLLLGEAVQYVKNLQVEVEKLEGVGFP